MQKSKHSANLNRKKLKQEELRFLILGEKQIVCNLSFGQCWVSFRQRNYVSNKSSEWQFTRRQFPGGNSQGGNYL